MVLLDVRPWSDYMTYGEWLAANRKEQSRETLRSYLHSTAGTEGWNSENKTSTTNVDYGVREAACALANARGGEVFIGVDDHGEVVGSEVTEETLNATLRQSGVQPADWFITDLLQVERERWRIEWDGGLKKAYVIEVAPPGLPVLVQDSGKLNLVVRSGSDTLKCDGRATLEWFTHWRRAEILRACYVELAQFSGQISLFRPIPAVLPDRLPYLTRAIEDGSFYRYLTPEDRRALVGQGVGGGRGSGAVDLYYDVVTRVRGILRGQPSFRATLAIRDLDQGLAMEFADVDNQLRQSLSTLAGYLRVQ